MIVKEKRNGAEDKKAVSLYTVLQYNESLDVSLLEIELITGRTHQIRAQLAAAGHPLLGALRERNYQYNMPVHIDRNCWLGAGVIVLPGVTIGDNTVVGAGSVVTKDLPSHVLAVGSPARVVRELGSHEREFYFKDRRIDPALLEGI